MSIQLHCGDCLTVMQNIAADSVDIILVDLPYGLTKNKWDTVIPFDAMWAEFRRIAKSITLLRHNLSQVI